VIGRHVVLINARRVPGVLPQDPHTDGVGADRQTPERWHNPCVSRRQVGRGPTDVYVYAKEIEIMAQTEQSAAEAQQTFFRITDNVPEEAWYWAALGSIGISAMLKLSGKDDWAIFVGQWPPTFLLFGLYHRLIRPSRH
jgi:hypothetical protein